MKKKLTRIVFYLLALSVVALIVVAFLPSPIKVETARVTRGTLRVTVDEEGEARAHDRFVVAAPIAGRLTRVELHDGDPVSLNQVVAVINPLPIDQRERAEITARVQAAEALKRSADEAVEHARADHEQAKRDLRRAEDLVEGGVISRQSLEQARNAGTISKNELEAARFKAQASASEVDVAKAGLIAVESGQGGAGRLVTLRSPVRGRVLRVIEKSERVVTSGTPIITAGDPRKLEVVVDLLSTDAVKVKPGAAMLLENWGGEAPIMARVRIVEPSAFTKVSALGIEEQRANVVADFVDPPGPLGDGYRVEARIVIWEAESVLKVPSSALFRHGDGWSVFVVENGKAIRREVKIGHRSQFETEVLSGIEESAQVVVHPTNQISDGARVEVRLS
ncbi:MAG TPA: efflux RND transporter periplasmic adaptor subunit [Blastocatellia bacterium]|nr:efflux RND transporter periplasmic adaptor subunit [Blastocatellia bacterium]